MDKLTQEHFSQFVFNQTTPPKNITSVLGVPLPKDYLAFMQKHNGGEGIAGNDAWLHLYPLEELEEATKDYDTQKILPNHCLIGTDGGGMLLGVDELGNYFAIDCISINPSEKILIGNTFEQFIQELNNTLYG